MSDKAYVNTQLNALPADIRLPLRNAMWYQMDNFRIGTGPRATNAQWFRVTGTTHATAQTEFSVKHGLSYAPSLLMPILDLSVVNSQTVPLTVSRAADAERIYLKSSSTTASFVVLLE